MLTKKQRNNTSLPTSGKIEPNVEVEEEKEKGRGKRTQRLQAFRRFFDLPTDTLYDGLHFACVALTRQTFLVPTKEGQRLYKGGYIFQTSMCVLVLSSLANRLISLSNQIDSDEDHYSPQSCGRREQTNYCIRIC